MHKIKIRTEEQSQRAYLNGIGSPFSFMGIRIPTIWFVVASYLIFGTRAVASSDSHTTFLVLWSSRNLANSLHRSSPSFTRILVLLMQRTKMYHKFY